MQVISRAVAKRASPQSLTRLPLALHWNLLRIFPFSRMAYGRLTWQGLENISIHVSLVLMVVYAVAIAAFRLGRLKLRQSVAYFA